MFEFVEFINKGREGEVIYHKGLNSIRFYMEFGGNDVVFILNIPGKDEWEIKTKFPLNKRAEILLFVAEESRNKQAPSCNYMIGDTEILFMKKG